MSKHKQKIQKIFEHPISGNIDSKKLLGALEHFGAEIDLTKENHAKIHLNGKMFSMPLGHNNTLAKDTIVDLHHYLEEVGLTPDTL
jgi:hypothetical protein